METLRWTLVLASVARAAALGGQPNPPAWPSSVRVFSPGDTDIEDAIAEAYYTNGGHDPPNHGQFSNDRYAFLFKPGTYDVDCPVGYYTQILGLGKQPSDVTFVSRGVSILKSRISLRREPCARSGEVQRISEIMRRTSGTSALE